MWINLWTESTPHMNCTTLRVELKHQGCCTLGTHIFRDMNCETKLWSPIELSGWFLQMPTGRACSRMRSIDIRLLTGPALPRLPDQRITSPHATHIKTLLLGRGNTCVPDLLFPPQAAWRGKATSHGAWTSTHFWQTDYLCLLTGISGICGISSVDFFPCFSDQLIPTILLGLQLIYVMYLAFQTDCSLSICDFYGRNYSMTWQSNFTSLISSWITHLNKTGWHYSQLFPERWSLLPCGYFLSTKMD